MDVSKRAQYSSFETLFQNYSIALDKLRNWGIRIDQTSRLSKYKCLLKEYMEREPPVHYLRELRDFPFVLREIDEIIKIVESFDHNPSTGEIELLSELHKGNIVPDKDTDSEPRDKQYELWLNWLFKSRGIESRLADPDLMVNWGGNQFPIEAKRPKTRSSLDDRLRRAVRQLDIYHNEGIIAISLDQLLRARNHYLDVVSESDAAQAMDTLFVSFIDWLKSERSPLMKRISGRNVIGVVITGRLPLFIQDSGLFWMETRQEILIVKNGGSKGLYDLREMFSSFGPQ